MVLMGSWMRGPWPLTMSKGMFMPVRGVRMSENRMTPSGLNACHGCREISTYKCRTSWAVCSVRCHQFSAVARGHQSSICKACT